MLELYFVKTSGKVLIVEIPKSLSLDQTLTQLLHSNRPNDGLANFGDKDKVANVPLDLLIFFQSGQQ